MKGKIEKWINRIRSLKLKFQSFLARIRAIVKRLEFLSPLLKKENMALLILGVVIVYGIIAQLLGWV